MLVQIRLFAALRDRAGVEAIELDLPQDARVADAIAAARDGGWVDRRQPCVLAVNREYAQPSSPLHEGDELALIPPVSGGAGGATGVAAPVVWARIRAEALSLDTVVDLVRDPRAGAVVTFSGVTREVPALEYEAYLEMAARQLLEVARSAAARHGLCRAAVEHRIGLVALSEPSVVIAASAPHRAEAFAGAREIIDVLKHEVPIWKREEGRWAEGSLPGTGSSAEGSLPGAGSSADGESQPDGDSR